MILEAESLLKYGYLPMDLKQHSTKHILVACDKCGKIRETNKNSYHPFCMSCAQKGRQHTEETKALISAAQKGKKNHMFGKSSWNHGKHTSEEQKAKLRAALKGKCTGEKSHSWRGGPVECICKQCGNIFYTKQCEIKNGNGKYCCLSCVAKARRYNVRPPITAPEKTFMSICRKCLLPFHFVGDGALWLGRANPDFVHNTKKIVVEIFGDYWHSPLLNHKMRNVATVKGRTEQLKAEGYKCIILWESDLKRKDAEAFVMHLMQKEKILRQK